MKIQQTPKHHKERARQKTGMAFCLRVMTMQYRFEIKGRLIGLNDYINVERTNRYKAAKTKADQEQVIGFYIQKYLKGVRIENPVHITYRWIEQDKRRDKDNICFAKKFINDALVRMRILENDGWKQVEGFTDEFCIDRINPRIEVEIKEVTT